MIRGDFHTHTVFCDGHDTAETMVREALRLGMTHLGFSGHMDQDIHMELPAYTAEIRRLQALYRDQLDILLGIELDVLYDTACTEGLDYWIGSTHYIGSDLAHARGVDCSPEQSLAICEEDFHGDWYRMCRAYYELEATVYDRTGCTWVGHFDLISRFNDTMQAFDETDLRYLGPAAEAMEYLCAQQVPFEINLGAFNRGKKELYPRMELLRLLHDLGGRIVLSTDAHNAANLMRGMDTARERALACGFREVWYPSHGRDGRVELCACPLD